MNTHMRSFFIIDVIINNGPANTAWSGGHYWKNERIVTAIREWVYNGGGFIGIEDSTAYEFQGRFFQLADVLGVQKEVGNSIQVSAPRFCLEAEHFITSELNDSLDLGVHESFVFVGDPRTKVLAANPQGHILIALHDFGKGRSVFLAGLPYSCTNSRLLHRALFWSSRKEGELRRWFSTNPQTDCAAFPDAGCFVVANASNIQQETTLFDGEGKQTQQIVLSAYASKWFEIE